MRDTAKKRGDPGRVPVRQLLHRNAHIDYIKNLISANKILAAGRQTPAIGAVIIANKIDLVEDARKIFGLYETINYRVLYTSTKTGAGIEELKSILAGKISAFAGPSGAGKSSLLNAMQPGLGLAVNEISKAMDKGKHTTVTRQLFPLEGGGYVADTPGWKSLALWDTEPEEIDGYFPELRELVQHCQFNDCTHTHEPGCAVRRALDEGKIHDERYESYLRLRSGKD